MQDLAKHELFEMEVLETLSKEGFLKDLVFGGGTMLRLCHEFPRYSVDLDFWFAKKTDSRAYYKSIHSFLAKRYQLSDAMNKTWTLLFECRSKQYPRRLKIEIRKDTEYEYGEEKIAYSKHGNKQVLVKAFSLERMGLMKMNAISTRSEIRDLFDFEQLMRKGVRIPLSDKDKELIAKRINSMKKRDYQVILGSLLESELRNFYIKNGFRHLLGYM